MSAPRYGATPEDWSHFDVVLGLGQDLLPVVSNPSATISPDSKMKALGKTPSRYTHSRQVVGIADWTAYHALDGDLTKWACEPDYGICVQTRTVRAIDVDITDAALAAQIHDAIQVHLGCKLPARVRAGAEKFLLLLSLPGEMSKRVLRTEHGIVEFLATGQQFVAIGTHPSGTRYEWEGGLPAEIPVLDLDTFEALWKALEQRFAVEPSKTADASVKASKLKAAAANDPVAQALSEKGLVISDERDGRLHIECPFADEHTGPSAESATTYWPANTGGYQLGHFHCLHAHCDGRTDRDFLEALDLAPDPRDDFEAIVFDDATHDTPIAKAARFAFVDDSEFSAGAPMGWIVKGVIPRGELGVIYGPPGSGKTFFALDLAMAIALGEAWCGRKVNKGRVGYIAAEGAGGFRNRIQAYRIHREMGDEGVLKVLAAVPNLLERQDVIDLGNAIIRMGGLEVLIYDTLARGTTGGDENSAQDMGLAIANCRTLHDVTGAMVILIHHSGKDASRGARGSNAILGAVDVEIEVSRFDDNRTAKVSKLKDGEDGVEFGFKLHVVPLGMDEDGDLVSSCVVEHGAVARRKPKEKKMGDHEQRIWHTVLELQGMGGENPSVASVISAAVEATPYDAAGGKDRRREVLGRALGRLVNKEKIQIIGGKVAISGGDA